MPDADTTIRAPWTTDQVVALNAYQQRGGIHPFTCASQTHDETRTLIAAHSGWFCPHPNCDYTQDWAHAFMANPDTWPNPLFRTTPAPAGPADSHHNYLRARIADALRQAAHDCDSHDHPNAPECRAQHPVQVAAWHHGVVSDVYGPVDAIAQVVADALQPKSPMDDVCLHFSEHGWGRCVEPADHAPGKHMYRHPKPKEEQ